MIKHYPIKINDAASIIATLVVTMKKYDIGYEFLSKG